MVIRAKALTTWTFLRPKQLHVKPANDYHIESSDCECHPTLDYEDENTQDQVWEHNWGYKK